MAYITAREFDRFEERLNERLGRLEKKVDMLCAREVTAAVIDGKALAKKTAVHVSWITPLIVALIESLKAAFR